MRNMYRFSIPMVLVSASMAASEAAAAEPSKSFFDTILENPYVLGGIGAIILFLIGVEIFKKVKNAGEIRAVVKAAFNQAVDELGKEGVIPSGLSPSDALTAVVTNLVQKVINSGLLLIKKQLETAEDKKKIMILKTAVKLLESNMFKDVAVEVLIQYSKKIFVPDEVEPAVEQPKDYVEETAPEEKPE